MPGTPSRVPTNRGHTRSRTRTARMNAMRSLGTMRSQARRAGVFPVRPHSVQPLSRPLSQTPPTSPHHLSRRSVGQVGLLSDPHNDLLFTKNGQEKVMLETPAEAENEENHSPGFYERKRAATRSRHLAYRQAVKNVAEKEPKSATRSTTRSKRIALLKAMVAKARHPRGYGLPKPVGSRVNGPSVLRVLNKRGIPSNVPGHAKEYRKLLEE